MTRAVTSVSLSTLADDSITSAPVGAHIVLEASSVLLHAVRMPEGLVALRRGSVQSFQVKRLPPAAALVCYPPPFGPLTDAEAMQAIERARGLVGLDVVALTERLVRAGADKGDLCGEAQAGECLASYCATGAARGWRVSEAYRNSRSGGSSGKAPAPAEPTRGYVASTLRPPPVADARPEPLMAEPRHHLSGFPSSQQPLACTPSADDRQFQVSEGHSKELLSTAVHVGLRGPAAKMAGAAAAIGFEGYALYKDIGGHQDQRAMQNISSDQFKERVTDSTITSSGRALGGLAGAVAGQAAIPVPIVGAMVGGIVGAAAGGLHASSFSQGIMALSGGRAKGGDDLVRCIEHKPRDERAQNFSESSLAMLGGSAPEKRLPELRELPAQQLRPRASAAPAGENPSGWNFEEEDQLL